NQKSENCRRRTCRIDIRAEIKDVFRLETVASGDLYNIPAMNGPSSYVGNECSLSHRHSPKASEADPLQMQSTRRQTPALMPCARLVWLEPQIRLRGMARYAIRRHMNLFLPAARLRHQPFRLPTER